MERKEKEKKLMDREISDDVPKRVFLYYIVSFLLPLLGFVFALGYSHHMTEKGRLFGRRCFYMGLSGLGAFILFLIFWTIFIFLRA